MLNYIWSGLIVASLVFALWYDVGDLRRDTYRNGQALPVELVFPEGYEEGRRVVPVEIRIDPADYRAFYGTEAAPTGPFAGELLQTREGRQLRFAAGADLPEPLATIQGVSQSGDGELQGTLVGFEPSEAGADAPGDMAAGTGSSGDDSPATDPGAAAPGAPGSPGSPGSPGAQEVDTAALDGEPAAPGLTALGAPGAPGAQEAEPPDDATPAEAAVRFEPVRFAKMNAIAQAALDFAETAAEIALGLIGVLALFLGLLKIAEEAGIIHSLVRVVRPVLRPLFPELPPDHPALGMIALNLTANVFGLGNAATPFGIKAMEELQTLNPTEDTATNSMVMLLAINTASVQIMPPVLLLALLGLQINQLIFAIIITTGLSLVIAVVAAKVYGRLPGSRASDPHRAVGVAAAAGADDPGPSAPSDPSGPWA